MKMSSYIFFLGGYDAEMVEIRDILETRKEYFYDKKLSWGACLSAYKQELSNIPSDAIPVLIELKIDMPIPLNAKILDHQGDRAGKDSKTSIEQVAELLGVELSRKQKLISANDKGHFRAMIELCATDEEIAEIRALDRKAQGVTEEDERRAEKSIKEHLEKISHNAVVVNSLTNRTSTIFDRLYGKYNHIFVFTPDGEMNYSGTGAVVNSLVKRYKEKQRENPSLEFWYGGSLPDYGFFGAKSQTSKDEINEVLNDSIISQHIFMFPFRLKTEDTFKNLKSMIEKDEWQYKPFDFKFGDTDAAVKYSEYVYFHEHVRRAIFSGGSDAISFYFDREIPDGARMVLHIKGRNTYTLPVHHISLRLFDTKVGILTIELLNYDYPAVNDILRINEFGRRIYPQFIDEWEGIEETKKIFLADKIEFYFGNEPIIEDFLQKELRVASYITYLLGETLKDKFIPVIDDRMFTVCWYGDDELSRCLGTKRGSEYKYESSGKWYSLIYVDGSVSGGIANKSMQKELIKAATYERWAEYGTLYGISRYSLVCITDRGDFGYNIIRNHMQRVYYQMAIILLAQRASILKFSGDVSEISGRIERMKGKIEQREFREIAEEVKNLHSSFIHFVNRLWFIEVTPQEQGIEMYNMAMKNMGLKEQLNELRHEIEQLYNFIDMQYEKEINRRFAVLDKIAFIFLPVIVVAALLGVNIFSPEDIPYGWFGRVGLLVIVAGIVILGTYVLWRYYRKERD
jgi:Mg2+ and Co2+ transporter CorA